MNTATRPRRRRWRAGLCVAALAWVGALLWAPGAAAAPSSTLRFHAAGFVYLAGRTVCHQQGARSLHLAGTQLPVCARCTGLYLGALVGSLVAVRSRGRLATGRARGLLLIVAVPTAATVAAAWFGWGDVSNAARAWLAVPLGAALGWAVPSALDEGLE